MGTDACGERRDEGLGNSYLKYFKICPVHLISFPKALQQPLEPNFYKKLEIHQRMFLTTEKSESYLLQRHSSANSQSRFWKTRQLSIPRAYLQSISKIGDRVDNRYQNKLVRSALANEHLPVQVSIYNRGSHSPAMWDIELLQPAPSTHTSLLSSSVPKIKGILQTSNQNISLQFFTN